MRSVLLVYATVGNGDTCEQLGWSARTLGGEERQGEEKTSDDTRHDFFLCHRITLSRYVSASYDLFTRRVPCLPVFA